MTYEPIFTPAPKPRRTARTVLIVVGAVLAVCCVGGAVGGFALFRSVSNAIEPARDAATSYVDDVRAGDYPSAYGRLCQEVRDTTTLEDFTRAMSAGPRIQSYEINGVNVSNFNGRSTATVTARMTQDSGATLIQVFPLVKEDGEWRVCQ
ncbi:Rv0361 family membrane protein [Phytohabitans houttuyneae]|nr:DUF4878 domain-containing protein [Phytohabitans houttuyneae]